MSTIRIYHNLLAQLDKLLRHSCAVEWYTQLLAQGKNGQEACAQVSRWLGHERPEITRIYLASLNKGGGVDV